MLLQYNNWGFSVPLVFRSKAQRAGKASRILLTPLTCIHAGKASASCSRSLPASMQAKLNFLVKRYNTAAGHQGNALRVSLSAPMDCVAPLGKGAAIPCETRLAMNADKLTESIIIMLKEHRRG